MNYLEITPSKNSHNKGFKQKAFTLAEVLIVLTIIGVVASLTIPALMQSTQDQQYKTAWKKEFSAVSNAYNQILNVNGGNAKGLFVSNTDIKNQFASYLSSTKSCDGGVNGCWHLQGKWISLSGISRTDSTEAGLILNDGAFIRFWLDNTNCNESVEGVIRCGGLTVDVNGFKGPNTIGKDIFFIHLESDSLKSFGTQGDNYSTNYCQNSVGVNAGYGCATQYLQQ